MGIKKELVTAGDVTMKYFKFGYGKGIFVILPGLSVQSVMDSAEAVAEAYKMLQKDYTVYVLDRRENLPNRYVIEDMARDTAAVMRELGLKDVNLFGASQGGMMAMVIAIENPDLVESLILGSTSSHVGKEQYSIIDHWITLAKSGKVKELYLDFGEKLYPPDIFEQYRGYLLEAAEGVQEYELNRFIILAQSIQGFDVTSRLDGIRCPVLIIGEFADEVLGSDATMEIAEKIEEMTDTNLFLYNGYGHAAFDTAPNYKKKIKDFLEGLDIVKKHGLSAQ